MNKLKIFLEKHKSAFILLAVFMVGFGIASDSFNSIKLLNNPAIFFKNGDTLSNRTAGIIETGSTIKAGSVDVTGAYTVNGVPISGGGGSSIDTTKIGYLAKNQTWAGVNTFEGIPVLSSGVQFTAAGTVIQYADIDNNMIHLNTNSAKKHIFQNLVSATPTQIMAVSEAGVETRALYSTPQTISALDINWRLSNTFTKTISSTPVALTFSNTLSGQMITVSITNTGSNVVTWSDSNIRWSGGTAPTQTIGAKTDVYTFVKIGSLIYGSVVQNFTP